MSEIKKEIMKLIKSRLSSSSFILLPNLYRSQNDLLKIIWLTLSIISASVCGWLMSRSIMDYYNYDVVTKTEVKYETYFKFPMITICNLNPFTTEYSNEFIRSYLNTSNPDFENGFFMSYSIFKHIEKNLTDPYLFGRRIDELIIDCSYGSIKCDLKEDFQHYYDLRLGNCYRFNSGKNMNGEKVEQKYANALSNQLNFQLWIGSAQNNNNMFSVDNGLIIDISDSENSFSNSVLISPGYTTKISLEKLTIIKKPKPYSNCVNNLNSVDSYDSLIYKKLIVDSQKYNYHSCNLMCFQRYLGDICKCQLDYINLTYFNDMRFCYSNRSLNEQDIKCVNETATYFLNDNQMHLKSCDCPIECEYNFYRCENSISEFPSRKYLSYLLKSNLIKSMFNNSLNDSLETFKFIRENVANIFIMFPYSMQTYITEYAKTQPTDLVSSVGGILGLFLGLSFLSFIEIFDLAIQIINVFFKQLNKKS